MSLSITVDLIAEPATVSFAHLEDFMVGVAVRNISAQVVVRSSTTPS